MGTAFDGLDRARGAVLTAVARTPLLPVLSKRDVRARARAIAAIVLGFAVTVVCPAAALAVSPLVLGVPHVAASVRYLVLRQGLSRRMIHTTVVFCAAIAGTRLLQLGCPGLEVLARLDVLLATAWAMLAAFVAAKSSFAWRRAAIAAAIIAAAGSLAWAHPTVARLLFVHLHNLGAVLLWVVAFRRGRFPAFTIGLLFFALALLLLGVTLPITQALGGSVAAGVDLRAVGAWLAPGLATSLALPLVLAHVFTDSVHYAFWLGVIPDETLTHQGSLSFKMTWRGLVRDFGRPGVAVIVGLAAVFALAGLMNGEGARTAYFAVAGFHGYVEGVMLVYVLVRGGVADERSSLSGERLRVNGLRSSL